MTTADRIVAALRPLAPKNEFFQTDVSLINQLAVLWDKRCVRRINAEGLALIKEFEGCRTSSYRDMVGVWTVGYGSTGPHVTPNLVLSPNACEDLLRSDLERFEQAVAQAAPNATDNQFAAMVALAFNIGISGFLRSTVLRAHLAGDHEDAAAAFALWNKAGGRVVNGLVRRRAAEAELYRRTA